MKKIYVWILMFALVGPLSALDWSIVTDENLVHVSDPHEVVPFQLTSETTLAAPYAVVSHAERAVYVDLGETIPSARTPDLYRMLAVGTDGAGLMTLAVGDKERGKYKLANGVNVANPLIAIPGEFVCDAVVVPAFKLDEVTPAGVLISEYRLFTVITGPTSADLYYGNSRLLTSEPGVRPPSMEMLLELTSFGKKIYLVRMALPQRDVIGFLFKFGKKWEFLFR